MDEIIGSGLCLVGAVLSSPWHLSPALSASSPSTAAWSSSVWDAALVQDRDLYY
jgi:hypothetical protein